MGHDECLFEGVLSFEDRMAHKIREYHPCRVRRKFPALLRAACLKLPIFLHRVVASMHEVVVRGTPGARQVKRGGNCARHPSDRILAQGRWQSDGLGKARCEYVECL